MKNLEVKFSPFRSLNFVVKNRYLIWGKHSSIGDIFHMRYVTHLCYMAVPV